MLFLAGCNTMEGLNKDLKIGGDEIKNSGEQVYKSLKTEETE
jgi:predicted small secreted protein